MTTNPLYAPLFRHCGAEAAFSAKAMLADFIAFEAELALALGAVGHTPPAVARQAAARIRAHRADAAALGEETLSDGLPVPAFVRGLKADLGAELTPAVHVGATSQDLIDTATARACGRVGDILLNDLATLAEALDALSARFGSVQMTARTRMQAALPFKAATRIAQWRAPLTDLMADLTAKKTLPLQYAGPVGDRRAPEGADKVAAHLAAALGLTAPKGGWHAMRKPVVDFTDTLSRITGALGKMGLDMGLMAQQGIDDIRLSGGGSSSAMAHKRNPVLAEVLVALARHNAALAGSMHQAMLHEQERSGAAWALEWLSLPQMAVTTCAAAGHAIRLAQSVERIGPPAP